MNKECCPIFMTFEVQNYFSLKDETPLALQANVVYLSEFLVARAKPISVKQRYIWQLG